MQSKRRSLIFETLNSVRYRKYDITTKKKSIDYKTKIFNYLESTTCNIIIILLTLIALFMDDIRLVSTDASADDAFAICTLIVFIFFVLELIIRCIVEPNYFKSFFFWLDLIAALSLIQDIPFFWYPILGIDQNSATDTDENSSLTIARAARSSRAATKAGRFVRFVRLLRIVRIGKLFEGFKRSKDHINAENKVKNHKETTVESAVGADLAQKTTRVVVMMVLSMLILIPMLKLTSIDLSHERAVESLQLLADSNDITNDTFIYKYNIYKIIWSTRRNFIFRY